MTRKRIAIVLLLGIVLVAGVAFDDVRTTRHLFTAVEGEGSGSQREGNSSDVDMMSIVAPSASGWSPIQEVYSANGRQDPVTVHTESECNCSGGENIGIANPAATYCNILGYKYEIVKTTDGETGICVLPNGERCSEWAFYGGECGAQFSYCVEMGWPVASEGKSDSYSSQCTTCILPDGSHQTVSELIDLSSECTAGLENYVDTYSVDTDSNEIDIMVAEQIRPDHFDWRDKNGIDWMTSVKNQGLCGSCWAFAAVGVTEALHKIAANDPDLDLDLSEQNLVSDCFRGGDCCGGYIREAFFHIRDDGITDENCFPYIDGTCTCKPSIHECYCTYGINNSLGNYCSDTTCDETYVDTHRCNDWSSRLTTVDEFYSGYYVGNKEWIKQQLILYGPLAAEMGMGVKRGGYFDGDIYRCDDDRTINHVVIIVGYDETEDYWIVKNSYGSDWNGDGYFKVGFEECAIESAIYSPEVYSIGNQVNTSTGTGVASFRASSGTIESLRAVDESTLPEEGKPNRKFPHGFFAFDITGLTPGETVDVAIEFPSDVPKGTQYWKYHPNTQGGWVEIPMSSNDGDNLIIITLVDGGLGDDDGVADGTIRDQGGPGWPAGAGATGVPVFPTWYIGIAAALGAGVLAYLLRRKSLGRKTTEI